MFASLSKNASPSVSYGSFRNFKTLYHEPNYPLDHIMVVPSIYAFTDPTDVNACRPCYKNISTKIKNNQQQGFVGGHPPNY